MFANEFDQENEPEGLTGYPEDWEEYLPAESGPDSAGPDQPDDYLPDDDPDYFPDPLAHYPPDDYQTDDYKTDDYSLGALPKFLFICTVVACLVLGVGLSLFMAQAPVEQPTTAQDQSQAGSGLTSDAGNSSCSVSQRFPDSIRRWCGLITQYASQHSLPPDLVAALIWQESGGNPVAYSQSGAVGLMQVMPSDGLAASFQCSGGPCFSSRPSTDQLKNPEFNVSYGTRMLAGLVGKTGSLREALKSYGPANVGYYYADKVLGIYQSYSN